MAVHGVDILETAQQVETLPLALTGCQRAIATTARVRSLSTQLEHPRVALPWLLEEAVTSALIFGPEYRGLSNVELNYAQRFVCIPSSADYPSLNLAQAVAVCCYELFQIAHELPEVEPQNFFPTPQPIEAAPMEAFGRLLRTLGSCFIKDWLSLSSYGNSANGEVPKPVQPRHADGRGSCDA
jgi:tRNA/rRNA methyltransferase